VSVFSASVSYKHLLKYKLNGVHTGNKIHNGHM